MPLDIHHFHTSTNLLDSAQDTKPSPLLLEACSSSLGITNTKKQEPVLITLLKLENSLFIQVGLENQNNLTNLFLSTVTKFSEQPLTTNILNQDDCTQEQSDLSEILSSRLSKKYKIPVVLSFNLEKKDLGVEKFLFEQVAGIMN
jgi:hypothetical protein